MIIDLPNASTRQVNRSLVRLREEGGAVALGRVFTLVIAANDPTDIEESILAANQASREHPCRIIVFAPQDKDNGSGLDAQIRVGGDAGASEVIVLKPWGDLVNHPDTLVMPLLLPDAPIVTWWSSSVPEDPSSDPLGKMAQRRITDSFRCKVPAEAIRRLGKNYQPGDTDLAWTRLTRWRALLATLLEQYPHEDITEAVIEGEGTHSSLDLLAAWLHAKLGAQVTIERRTEAKALQRVELKSASGSIQIERRDGVTTTISSPGETDRYLNLPIRSLEDCLAEELRRLDPDVVYGEVVTQGLPGVSA